jgi:hypothetical protein
MLSAFLMVGGARAKGPRYAKMALALFKSAYCPSSLFLQLTGLLSVCVLQYLSNPTQCTYHHSICDLEDSSCDSAMSVASIFDLYRRHLFGYFAWSDTVISWFRRVPRVVLFCSISLPTTHKESKTSSAQYRQCQAV